MSVRRCRKLQEATLEYIKQYRLDHPDQTREQFRNESYTLSHTFLDSRGAELFTVGGAKWAWPEDRDLIVPRVAEYLQTQSEYQKEREYRRKRKLKQDEQTEEDEQERAKKRGRSSDKLTPPIPSCSFSDRDHRQTTASRRCFRAVRPPLMPNSRTRGRTSTRWSG